MQQSLVRVAAIVAVVASPLGASARPCGQDAACPPITLEGPLPVPYPAADPLGLPNIPGGGRPVEALCFARNPLPAQAAPQP